MKSPTSSSAVSRVKTSRSRETVPVSPANAPDCGLSLPGSFARYDPVSSSWRTCPGCSHTTGKKVWPHLLQPFSQSFPNSGSMRSGVLFPLDPWAAPSCGSVYSSSPTLVASEMDRGNYQRDRGQKGKERLTLKGLVKSLECTPTLTARDHRSGMASEATHAKRSRPLNEFVQWMEPSSGRGGGKLNPRWLEWYMGFPDGWCEIPSEHLETA